MGLLSIFAVVLFSPFAKLLASTADYKNWYGTAQNSYSRGKSTYDDVLKAAQEREEECVILHSADRQIAPMQSNEWATDIGREQFPCLRQYDQNGILAVVGMHIVNAGTTVVFDINANIEEIAGPTRKQRVMAEGGCWQFVLNQINQLDVDSCDIKGEVSRSLIALAKTKCHFIRSRRAFPLAEHGCILDPQMIDDNALGIYKEQYVTNPCKYDYTSDQCQKLKEDIVAQCTNLRIMSESAFQMYHANLNHIDDICFYLQSNEWNRKTESNINKLGESASNLLYKHQNLEHLLDSMHKEQERSLEHATQLNTWMVSLQDDIKNVFRILAIIRSYQRKIVEFIHNFKLFLLYSLYILLAIAFTVFDATAWARPRIIIGIATACITDVLLHKVIFRWELLEQLPYSKVEIYTTVSKGIRWVTLIYATLYWIKAMLSYQPPAQAMLKEMSRIRKILTPCIVYPHIVSDSDCDHIEGGHARGYTLDDFVELFGDRSDSSYVYESGYTSEETDDEFLGEDSEDLVEEYLESKEKRRRHNTSARMNPNYKQI